MLTGAVHAAAHEALHQVPELVERRQHAAAHGSYRRLITTSHSLRDTQLTAKAFLIRIRHFLGLRLCAEDEKCPRCWRPVDPLGDHLLRCPEQLTHRGGLPRPKVPDAGRCAFSASKSRYVGAPWGCRTALANCMRANFAARAVERVRNCACMWAQELHHGSAPKLVGWRDSSAYIRCVRVRRPKREDAHAFARPARRAGFLTDRGNASRSLICGAARCWAGMLCRAGF